MAFNPFDPFSAFRNNFHDGYQFGDLTKSVMGIHNNQASGLSLSGEDPLSQFGNLVSGQTDFARNMELSAEENRLNRENMQIQNAFTASREDLAYARERDAMLDNRVWEEAMANTSHQREVADLKAAGLNPWLSAGGVGAPVPTGQLLSANSAQSAGISPLKLPESKIWANTSSSIKTAISSMLSLAIASRFL